MSGLPGGAVTFLFSDIEGSTRLVKALRERYPPVLAEHRRLVRTAIADQGGCEVDTQGDTFFAAFASAKQAVLCGLEIQRALADYRWPADAPIRVRIGIHTGQAAPVEGGYIGLAVHRAAQICEAARGGQVLVSQATQDIIEDEEEEPGFTLVDLGERKLKDLDRPVRLFELAAPGLQALPRLTDGGRAEEIVQLQAHELSTAFPPLRSLDDPRLLHNLPAQVSSFIGREAELAEVRALVGGSRLVTLTGAGGAGKTRLGLQVAAGLAGGLADGVWFVDLAELSDPGLVAVTVADVLGVRLEPGRAVPDTVMEAVGGRSLLVLLDNCEHVIGACAQVADALLRGCPGLALLATSREPLGIGGEHVYRVPSMRTPAEADDTDAIRTSEAVRLLEDRAAAQGVPLAQDEQTTAVVGRICRRLDGIPLALELAAARLRVMSAGELEARLDERFALLTGGSRAALARQQTLRAMVDWSWELLAGLERAVLARLSTFAGGFGLAAAEAVVAGAVVAAGEVLDLLGALVDKSLVQFGDAGTGPGRYRLLETVRQYAAGRLDAQGPAAAAAARTAHRDYYLALAEAAAPQLVGSDQAGWLDLLDAELGNLRAAIAFSLTDADPEPGLRLAASVRVFWLARGHAAEAADALQALLDLPAAQGATLPRARALSAAANLVERAGSYAAAERYCEEALAIARVAGDDHLVAEVLLERAWILLRQGQPGTALPLIEQGLSMARPLQEPRLTGLLLSARSHVLKQEGDHAGSARDAARSLQLCRQAGDQRVVGMMLGELGNVKLVTGDLDAARRHLHESLDIFRALHERYGIVVETFNLGLAECLGGSPGAGEALFAESLGLARRMGMKSDMAYALIGLALAGRGGADPGRSARLHGAADQALAGLGETLEPLEARLADLDRQRLRTAMGAEAFDAEYAAGRTLDLALAAHEALRGMETERAGALVSERDAAVSGEAASVLTPRELDVLKLVAQGLSNPDIARRLGLSEHTVHRHLANILRKLNLSSRAAVAAWAVRTGIV